MKLPDLLLWACVSLLLACTPPSKTEQSTETEAPAEAVAEVQEVDIVPVFQAVEDGDLETLRQLIGTQAYNLDYHREHNDETLLTRAARLGRYDMVPVLITNGADPDLVTGEFLELSSPLIAALKKDDLRMVKTLKEAGATLNVSYTSWFVNVENKEMMDYLTAAGMDLNADFSVDVEEAYTRLDYALKTGDFDLAEKLLQVGASLTDQSVWQVQSQAGMELLRQHGYDFGALADMRDIGVGEAYLQSIFNRSKKLALLLLQYGVRPSMNSLLLVDDPSVLQELIKSMRNAGVDFNQNVEFHNLLPFNLGFQLTQLLHDLQTTPLCMAANTNKPDLVKALLQAGADPNTRDKHGRVPLFYAHFNKHTTVSELLNPVTDRDKKLIQMLGYIITDFAYHEQQWTESWFKRFFDGLTIQTSSESNRRYGLDGNTGTLISHDSRPIAFMSDDSPNELVLFSPYAVLPGEVVQSPILYVGLPANDALERVGVNDLQRNEISGTRGLYSRPADRFEYGFEVTSDNLRIERLIIRRTR